MKSEKNKKWIPFSGNKIWRLEHFFFYTTYDFSYVVLTYVILQIARQFAGVIALLAGKRFLTGVWKHVIPQIIELNGRIVALFTHKKAFLQCVRVCASWDFELERKNSYTAHN